MCDRLASHCTPQQRCCKTHQAAGPHTRPLRCGASHLLALQPADAQALLRVALRLRPRAMLRSMHLQRGQELRYLPFILLYTCILMLPAAGCRII